jgi:hypothetical protein
MTGFFEKNFYPTPIHSPLSSRHPILQAAESNVYDKIGTAQHNDEDIQIIKQKLAEGTPKYTCFQKDHQDVIWFGKRLVVHVDPKIKKTIFDEAHMSKFSIHPDSTKMYQDLKQNF